MDEETIKLFEINTDAIATNRGFYYQYLIVLKKWITNYIDDTNLTTLTEVEDDIKEIGDEIIFTQVKCYTSSFSLNSKEIKKSIFNFFILYSKYKNLNEKLSFCFSTNSQISKREKLLFEWTRNLDLNDNELLDLCVKKVKEILTKEVKERRIKLLQKGLSVVEKKNVNKISNDFKDSLDKNSVEPFVKSILWEFNDLSPEKGVELLTKEILGLLEHIKFEGKPKSLLFKVLISEIYRRSQKKKSSDRELNNKILLNIIKQTDNELSKSVNSGLIKLFRIEIESLKLNVEALRKAQDIHSLEIDSLKENLKSPFKKLPKHLNLIPDFSSQDIIGWGDFLNKVNSVLSSKKVISIYSQGGMGKTSFGKKYLKTFATYDHIIWLNVEKLITTSLLLDDVLKENINLSFQKDNQNAELVYKSIVNALNKIDGENLIVVDIQNCENENSEIKSLTLASNWQKLILTRSHLQTTPSLKLPILCFEEAKEVYRLHCSRENVDDMLFKDLFKTIDYNPLVIELIAKTIYNSYDLSLSSFLISLKEQRLDDVNFMIDIEINDSTNSIRIFNYLIERFGLPTLSSLEKNYLEFLALLPSTNIVIEDIILINGLVSYNENKITIVNILNSLDKNGLVTISADRKTINIHKITREILIYNQRERSSPFMSHALYINWLTRRIEEGYNSPKKSFRYLKYAESILNSIKEEYRSNIYQPLLLLENEYFYAKRFFLGAKNDLSKMIDLALRAENFASFRKESLGVIYNNLGLCYAENNERQLAITYFKKALKQFPKGEKTSLGLVITTLNNMSSIYLIDKDLPNAIKNFKKVQNIRNKHSLFDDQQLSIEYRILSRSYAIAGSFKEAISLLKSGIKLHESLNTVDRNDFNLAAYHNELSNLYLVTENIEEAILNQEKGVQILENMGLQKSSYLLSMYQISLDLYEHTGSIKKAKEITEKIKLFKIYQS